MTKANGATITQIDGNWIGAFNGKKIVKSYDKTRVVKMMAKAGYANVTVEASANAIPNDAQAQWPINQRFGFVTQLVTMIAQRLATSAIITGPGGLGKSHTVRVALERAGLKDASDLETLSTDKSFTVIKGYSTAKGLYREMYNNKNSVIVFDDCDSILKDPVALNLLKGALDSNDKRVIGWNAEMKDEDLPTSFRFEGRIIFISNLKRENMDQALRTRAYCVDLSMTTEQKLERMAVMISEDDFMPRFDQKHKEDSLNLIKEMGDRATEISLRTLQSVTRIRASGGNWRSLAEYVLTN